MKGIFNIVVNWLANGLALWLAGKYIEGVSVSGDLKEIAIAAAVLTGVNLIIRPILKVVLSPIIILTLGLAIIAINAFTIYIMTHLVPGVVDITGLLPLLYVTILTSLIGLITRRIL